MNPPRHLRNKAPPGGERVLLYIEGEARKFGQMLSYFAETTGLSMREAQAPIHAADNYVRNEKDLAGEDVSDMDSADAVMAEIRAALAEEDSQSTDATDDGNITADGPEATDEQRADRESDQAEPESQEDVDRGGRPDGQQADDGRGENGGAKLGHGSAAMLAVRAV